MLLVAIYLSLGVLAANCSGSTAAANCEAERTINNIQICTQCIAGYVPINGACTKHDSGDTNTICLTASGDIGAGSQICEKCAKAYFLYENGCYHTTDGLGKTLCARADAGVCTTGADGYFALPGALDTEVSVAPCNTTVEITLTGNKKYKGVEHCATCTAPGAAAGDETKIATCQTCTNNYVPQSSGTVCGETCVKDMIKVINKESVCTQCIAGYVPINGACTKHDSGDTNTICLTASGDIGAGSQICEKCAKAYFLYENGCYHTTDGLGKTLCARADAGVCTTGADGYFALPGALDTEVSVAPCNTTVEITLTGNKKYKGVEHCATCTAPGAAAGDETKIATCQTCTNNYVPQSSGTVCGETCVKDMIKVINKESVCTQCIAGYVPINGACTKHDSGDTNTICLTASGDIGAGSQICEKCAKAYFLYENGCYHTTDGLGKTLCARADAGVCTTGADGYFALPGALDTEVSVAPCNTTVEITLTGNKKYKGVEHCATCTAPGAAAGDETKIATCQTCTNNYVPQSSGTVCGETCVKDMIKVINKESVCTQCIAGYVPINGACTKHDSGDTNTICLTASGDIGAGSQICEKCAKAYFLYENGCYHTTDGLGKTLCARADAGVCTTGADGYFALPGALDTEVSVAPCNTTVEITLTGNKKYKGVEHCATCTAPGAAAGDETKIATCQTCTNNYVPQSSGTVCGETCVKDMIKVINKESVCTQCIAGYVPINGACTKHDSGDTNTICLTASGDIGAGSQICEKCAKAYFLYENGCYHTTDGLGKTLCARADAGVCTTGADGYFALPGALDTEVSVAPCNTTVEITLTGNKKYKGVEHCATCTAPGAAAGDETKIATCQTCTNNYVPQSSGTVCGETCVKDMIKVINKESVCTQCIAGYVPINGACTKHDSGDTNTICLTASGDIGAGSQICEKCAKAYFLYENGCYHTTDGLGKTLCARADAGVCTTGADGYFALPGALDTEVSVAPCNTTVEITLTGNKKYKGVEHCATCTAPGAAAGDETKIATCQTCTDKSKPKDNVCPSPENPNINRNSLPPGAIAGIAVAVVIVVGGLVGFLCWWFICRGKA